MAECRGWCYEFDVLADGTRIKPGWRELVRSGHPALQNVENPFDLKESKFDRLVWQQKKRKVQTRAIQALSWVFNNS